MRRGESPAAAFDGLLIHVDAPEALGIDSRVGIRMMLPTLPPK